MAFFLVVLGVDFEVGLGMGADGADLRRGGAHDDMSAVAALPYLDLALGEDGGGLHVLKQGAISLLVLLLYGSHHTELDCKLGEAFGLSSLGEAFVHIRPLEVLAVSGGGEVLCGAAYAVQLLEPELGVLFLIVGSLEEEGGYLLESVLLCL